MIPESGNIKQLEDLVILNDIRPQMSVKLPSTTKMVKEEMLLNQSQMMIEESSKKKSLQLSEPKPTRVPSLVTPKPTPPQPRAPKVGHVQILKPTKNLEEIVQLKETIRLMSIQLEEVMNTLAVKKPQPTLSTEKLMSAPAIQSRPQATLSTEKSMKSSNMNPNPGPLKKTNPDKVFSSESIDQSVASSSETPALLRSKKTRRGKKKKGSNTPQ